MNRKAKNPIKSTGTTFRLVEAVADADGIGTTELADEMDVSKATVHNHLSTLAEMGYVLRKGTEYHIGARFLRLGMKARDRTGLYEVSRPHVKSLARSTGELAHLVVEEGGYGICLELREGEGAPPECLSVGSSVPLHCTAVGKVILAGYSDDEVNRIRRSYKTLQVTPRSLTGREELLDELRAVREQGMAFSRGEFKEGVYSVAAPIKTADGDVAGSIGVSGPKARLSGKALQQDTAGLVLSVAKKVENEYQAP